MLRGPRLKIQWANRHIDFIKGFSNHLDNQFFELVISEHDLTPDEIEDSTCHISSMSGKHRTLPRDAKFRVTHLTYWPKKPIPEVFALLIGDAVHNLRSALDHLATGIIRETGESAEFINFPLHQTRENLIASEILDAIEEAVPGAKKLVIDDIKPYEAGNGTLWALTKLDNIDKHNLIIPTVAITRLSGVNLQFAGGSIFNDASLHFNAANPQLLAQSEGPITVDKNIYATVAVTFDKGRFFEDEPVVPTLTQLAQFVTEALDGFQRLINATNPTAA